MIRNNVFHDVWPYSMPPFGWGIYLDAQCGNYTVEGNVVYNTRSGGLMFNNGGHEHVIQNKVFALSVDYALWPHSEKRPNTFRRKIVYLAPGERFVPYGERPLNERLAAKKSLGAWDENLYWHTGGGDRIRCYQRSFGAWQALGLDRASRVADPRFVDAQGHDFVWSAHPRRWSLVSPRSISAKSGCTVIQPGSATPATPIARGIRCRSGSAVSRD